MNASRLMKLFTVVLMVLGIFATPQYSKAETSVSDETAIPEDHIRVHYQRADDNYEGWGLHLWNADDDNPAIDYTVDWGDPVAFVQETSYGMYVDVPVSEITNGLNFIVHKGDQKDTSDDRTFPTSGEREFWLVQGQEEVYLEEPELSTQISSATITQKNEITGLLNRKPESLSVDDLKVLDGNGESVEIEKLESEGQKFVLTMGRELDLTKAYKVVYNEKERQALVDWQLVDDEFVYDGNDLGVTLHDNGEATMKFWSPPASSVSVLLYDKDDQSKLIKQDIAMTKGEKGVWEVKLDQSNTGVDDLTGYYYQFEIDVYGETTIGLDPYAKSMAASTDDDEDTVGKAAIVNPATIGPKLDFASIPGFEKREDAIIWEAHVRDFTSDPDLESELDAQFGTFNSFAEKLDYLKDLGVTHVQLLPVMKYYFGDELANDERELEYSSEGNNYNWGYDPHSYFSPSGMYSERPEDPEARIAELKALIDEIHKRDMGVVLDVVYNHTALVSIFEDLMPGYYHFMDEEGNPKTGYGGGKLGTTHEMTRKMMINSITYWVDEFKVDGFRFDLMGDLDAESVQIAYDEAKKLNPNLIMLGEGWRTFVGDGNDEDEVMPADQDWMDHTDSASVFSDEIRNELKSGFGSEGEPRFLTDGARDIETIFNNIKGQPGNFVADDPGDVVQYIAAHDNLTLHDVIAQSIKKDPADHEEEIQERIRLGNAMIMTSQGVSFLHAGQEYGRTKQWKGEGKPEAKETYMVDENGEPFEHPYFIHDSYDSTDAINMFDWSAVTEEGIQKETMTYTSGLIDLRKSTDAFRLGTKELVDANVQLVDAPEMKETDLTIGYKNVSTDKTGTYYVFVNADDEQRTLTLDEDLTNGKVLVDDDEAGVKKVSEPSGYELTNNSIHLDPLTTVIVKVDSEKVVDKRLSGDNRYETAIEISKEGWEQADTVVITRGDGFADALAGAPLAYKYDAPILLTESHSMDRDIQKEIKRLGASKAIVLGGNSAVSNYVNYQLKGLGLKVERISGDDRFETAANIAARLDGDPKKAIVANGLSFPDALAIAPYAAKNGYPILLTEKDELPKDTKHVLEGFDESIVVGGEAVVTEEVLDQLPGADRIGGADRFETAANIALLNQSANAAFISTGMDFADALSGSVLAAKRDAVSLLVMSDEVPAATEEAYDELGINQLYVLGGESAVSEKVKKQLLEK
ncbi:pullulanase [Bacillus sp. N1-1]|uniref:pullulanase n=1 Tax=Bacillus sp. N1-1 TaxID=2682541 RepID=UPI001315B4C9|nr:pullulanase [Bacillus sp. N1-1]QHA93579.1 pullulanase [Bacillus sp. N1-1]